MAVSGTFTGIGVSAPVQAVYPGSTTIILTNTSAFIGEVFAEISLDGQLSWPVVPGSSLTAGVMVVGPLNFSFAMNPSQWIRLHCVPYTSGTVSYVITPSSGDGPGLLLSTFDPHINGVYWLNGGFLCMSQG